MILFVSYGGGHVTMIYRIYNYFKSQGIGCLLLPLTTGIKYVIDQGIEDYIELNKLYKIDSIPLAWKEFIDSEVNNNHKRELGIPFDHTLAYYSIGLTGLFEELGFEKGKQEYLANGRKAFIYDKFARQALQDIKPSAVFVTNVARMERAFVRAAREKEIPSFAIDDLFGVPHEPLEADLIFVDNDVAKRNLLAANSNLKIIVSGNPVFDDISRSKSLIRNNAELLIVLQTGIRNLKSGEVRQFDKNFYERFFQCIQPGFCNFTKIHVRFHPSMKEQVYWEEASNIVIDRKSKIQDTISKVEFALGMSSTGLYEAYLAGCKCYAFEFDDDFFRLPIRASGHISLEGQCSFAFEHYSQCENVREGNSIQLIYKSVKDALSNN